MVKTHFSSGGRYPVLRTVAIMYIISAGFSLLGGLVGAVWTLAAMPEDMTRKIGWAFVELSAGFLIALSCLAIAEVLKLFIDIEHNSRMVTGDTMESARVTTSGNGRGRMTWLEGEETAEGALIRGH